jgi:hypothetical protein
MPGTRSADYDTTPDDNTGDMIARWLRSDRDRRYLNVPIPKTDVRAFWLDDPSDVSVELPYDVVTFTRERCVGAMPWTGKPARYEWWVAIDGKGGWVADESRIVPDPYAMQDPYWHWSKILS